MITVMGSTGHIGRKVTQMLLEAGERVRAIGRSQERLAGLAASGAEPRVGHAQDAAFLTDAFSGADAVLVVLPSDLQAVEYRTAQRRLSAAIATAVRDSGVPAAVVISSLGAELAEGTGPITTLHDLEQELGGLAGIDLLVLRPGYFYENFEDAVGLIKHQRIHANGVDPDVPVPMIGTRDIAVVAAEALRTRTWHGTVVRELVGPRDLTFAEVTRIIGTHLGVPDLPYVRMSDEDLEATYVEIGMSPDAARTYVEMVRALNGGTITHQAGRAAATKTPTPFEAFAEELAAQFADA